MNMTTKFLPALLVLAFSRFAAAAGSVCAQTPSALSQLAAAAPGGMSTFSAIKATVPQTAPAQRGGSADAMPPAELALADFLIQAQARSAERKGRYESARLFRQLLARGSSEEKKVFLIATEKPYAFPERFYPAAATASLVCVWITETFCTVSCWGTGAERECREECRNVIVKSCS